jgi:CDP-6-deoxy-D-xylo-4-hexulose-3-dehydrase
MEFYWPLMEDNIRMEDLSVLIDFLKNKPRLTQSTEVAAFEREWSEWLGVKYSVFVNSGSSANFLTMAALKELKGTGEIIVPPLTWISDVVSVIQHGFTPVFADINPANLCLDEGRVLEKLSEKTVAVFLSHIQGFNGLTRKMVDELDRRNILLIEDTCESHGAEFNGRKAGSIGYASNFSFYFGHHMSTVEGGMVCTNDPDFFQVLRMIRSHGMVRESTDASLKDRFAKTHGDLSPDFIFAYPGYNFRSSEIGAVLGRSQLKRLDANNELRRDNFALFLENLDPSRYRTDFNCAGSSNYAFNLILKEKDVALRDRVEGLFRDRKVEFRRGSSGGGNQLRQPYLRKLMPEKEYERYPETEHIHFFAYYIGNYPTLEKKKILELCTLLNAL